MWTGLPCDLSRGGSRGRGGGVAPPAGYSRLPILSTREIQVYLHFISSGKLGGRSVSEQSARRWRGGGGSVEVWFCGGGEAQPRTLGLEEKKKKKHRSGFFLSEQTHWLNIRCRPSHQHKTRCCSHLAQVGRVEDPPEKCFLWALSTAVPVK